MVFLGILPTERIQEKFNRKPVLDDRVVDGSVHERARVVFVLLLALIKHIPDRHVVVVALLVNRVGTPVW